MAGANVSELGEADFDGEVLKSDQPVLVDFWAPWCGPCRAIAPMIDELADENAGSAKIAKVNIDDSPSVSQKYGVDVIPTLLLFKGGEVVERFSGAQPKARLQEAIDSLKA